VEECKPLPLYAWLMSHTAISCRPCVSIPAAATQGLTLVHLSAQLKHSWWDKGCVQGLCSPR